MNYVFEFNGVLYANKADAVAHLKAAITQLVHPNDKDEELDEDHLHVTDRGDDVWVRYESANGVSLSGRVYRREVL